MQQRIIRYAVLGILGIGLLSVSLPAARLPVALSKDKTEKLIEKSKDPILQKNDGIRERLRKLVDFLVIDDPKVTLGELLEIMADRYELQFQVNEAAFNSQGIDDIRNYTVIKQPEPQPENSKQPRPVKPLPPLRNVPVYRVLNNILARLPVESGPTFLVRDGLVEITTRQAASPVSWTNPQARQFVPTITATFEEQRLDVALRELANRSGIDIVLDRRNSTAASMPSISAQFHQMPVDTAVRLLADMCGLRAIAVDTALYVTSKENAEKLRKQEQQEQEDAPARLGPGALGGIGEVGGFARR